MLARCGSQSPAFASARRVDNSDSSGEACVSPSRPGVVMSCCVQLRGRLGIRGVLGVETCGDICCGVHPPPAARQPTQVATAAGSPLARRHSRPGAFASAASSSGSDSCCDSRCRDPRCGAAAERLTQVAREDASGDSEGGCEDPQCSADSVARPSSPVVRGSDFLDDVAGAPGSGDDAEESGRGVGEGGYDPEFVDDRVVACDVELYRQVDSMRGELCLCCLFCVCLLLSR
jgi:hypothetical protein